ncbi:MAG: hypothetical protein M1274_00160, partial [Actinobacteria bacterium]|nr:hypothetical protein [Actinomycetota bacterium]
CRVLFFNDTATTEIYTVEVLTALKANHETWVSSSLKQENPTQSVCICRSNAPSHLLRFTSGQSILLLVLDADALECSNDEPESEDEVEMVARFLREIQDYGLIGEDLEAGDRVRAAFHLDGLLKDLEAAGLWVFGGREDARLEGGIGSPQPFSVGMVRVVRSNNPKIVKVNLQPTSIELKQGQVNEGMRLKAIQDLARMAGPDLLVQVARRATLCAANATGVRDDRRCLEWHGGFREKEILGSVSEKRQRRVLETRGLFAMWRTSPRRTTLGPSSRAFKGARGSVCSAQI